MAAALGKVCAQADQKSSPAYSKEIARQAAGASKACAGRCRSRILAMKGRGESSPGPSCNRWPTSGLAMGCGKSTLLKATLYRSLVPTSGCSLSTAVLVAFCKNCGARVHATVFGVLQHPDTPFSTSAHLAWGSRARPR